MPDQNIPPSSPPGDSSYLTPPGGFRGPWAIDAECLARHGRTNEALADVRIKAERADRRIMGLVGEDGDDGKVADMQEKLADHDLRVRNLEIGHARFAILAGVLAAVGGGSVAALVTWIINHM